MLERRVLFSQSTINELDSQMAKANKLIERLQSDTEHMDERYLEDCMQIPTTQVRPQPSSRQTIPELIKSIHELRWGMVRIQSDLLPLSHKTIALLESEAVGAADSAIMLHQK